VRITHRALAVTQEEAKGLLSETYCKQGTCCDTGGGTPFVVWHKAENATQELMGHAVPGSLTVGSS